MDDGPKPKKLFILQEVEPQIVDFGCGFVVFRYLPTDSQEVIDAYWQGVEDGANALGANFGETSEDEYPFPIESEGSDTIH